MMTPMRYHPVRAATDDEAQASRAGFGFDAIMADPDHTRFRAWYDEYSYFAPPRAGIAAAPSLLEAEAGDGSGLEWAA